jgi:glycosyltransferase involved in cell wall biosynthesis
VRVLHVVTDLKIGGAETMLCKLVDELSRQGSTQSDVISLRGDEPLGVRLRAAGARVHAVGMRGPLDGMRAAARLRERMRDIKPDVVQGWLYHGNLAALLSPSDAPVLWNVRSTVVREFDSMSGRAGFALSRMLSGKPWCVVYNAEEARADHERAGFRPCRARVLPNGFETDRMRPDAEARAAVRSELGVPEAAPVVGIAARAHPQKDYPSFLRAAAHVRRQLPDVHFVAVGRGVESDAALAQLSRDLGIAPVTRLVGERRDMHRVFAAFDVGVLSSTMEGFPNVVGEAMACGVPCVVTDVGAAASIVGDTGRVVPPRDPEALAKGILQVLEMDGSARKKLGELARLRIEHQFSMPEIARRYRALYEEAVA